MIVLGELIHGYAQMCSLVFVVFVLYVEMTNELVPVSIAQTHSHFDRKFSH